MLSKRIISLFIAFYLLSCTGKQVEHISSFERFVIGIVNLDIRTVEEVATETTTSMVDQLIQSQNLIGQSQIIDEMFSLANRKHIMQYNINVVNDSISEDGLQAWIWFKVGMNTEKLVAPMVKINGKWLVDIPVLDNCKF